MKIKKFSKLIQVENNSLEFSFHPMDIRLLRLFQVYVPWEGRTIRFHMQKDGEKFRITDPHRVPQCINEIEFQLSETIVVKHQAI